MKKLIVIAVLAVFSIATSVAQESASIENVWKIEKIHSPTGDVSYADWPKTYFITISKSEILVNGSCIKGVVKDAEISSNSIKYTSKTAWDPGCCFFDNPNEELMKMPEFEGDLKIEGEKLTIYHGDIIYYFGLKK